MFVRKAFLTVAMIGALLAPTMASSADAQVTVPVTQTLSGIGTFTGNLTLTSFRIVNGQLAAVGTLAGQITDQAGNLLGTIATQVTLPVTNTSGSCQILHLELGPLDLDLLGLQVHLDKIVLDISAQPGSGNLLGNLFCQIAGLLDNNGPLATLSQRLNQLLGVLGGARV